MVMDVLAYRQTQRKDVLINSKVHILAFYKLDYGLGTALARVHDADLSALVPVESFGRQPMITK
jgi:hypothetical protein